MMNVRRARGWLVLSALALGQLACTSMRNAPGKTAGLAATLSLLLLVQGFSAAGTMVFMQ